MTVPAGDLVLVPDGTELTLLGRAGLDGTGEARFKEKLLTQQGGGG